MTLTEIKKQTDEIYETYRARFAGFPRATRSLDEIDGLIQRLETVVTAGSSLLAQGRDPALASVMETAQENLQVYKKEKTEIEKAQKTPFARDSAVLAARANRVFDVYGRHYAGQDRATRDVRLLMDLVDELEDIQTEMDDLVKAGAKTSEADLETVNGHIDLYSAEIDEIRKARAQGTIDEQASRLAFLANAQFNLYNKHFAGKSRTTRRPELIVRMIENLEDYQRGMQALASSGYSSPQNMNNMEIVSQNLAMYRTELEEIRKIRQTTSASDLAGALGGSANEVMAEYRENFAGHDRKSRDLEHLGAICDQLRDVYLQMLRISRAVNLDFNFRNMDIVSEARGVYEAEWLEVKGLQ